MKIKKVLICIALLLSMCPLAKSETQEVTRDGFHFGIKLSTEDSSLCYLVKNTTQQNRILSGEINIFSSRYVTAPLPERSFYRLRSLGPNQQVLMISEWIECADYGSRLTIETSGKPPDFSDVIFLGGELRTRHIPLGAFLNKQHFSFQEFVRKQSSLTQLQAQISTTLSRKESPDDATHEGEARHLITRWLDL